MINSTYYNNLKNNLKNKLEKIKSFFNDKPYLFVAFIYILHFTLNFLYKKIFLNLIKPITNLIYNLSTPEIKSTLNSCFNFLSKFTSPAFCFLIALFFGYSFIYKFKNKQKDFLKTLKLNSFVILMIIINISYAIVDGVFINKYKLRSLNSLMFFLICYLCEAFTTNTLSLGITLNCFIRNLGFNKKKIWFCLTITSIIFGCTHFINIFTIPNVNFFFVFAQVLNAFSSYMYTGAAYLRGNSLWAIIICQGLLDCQIFEIFNAPERSIEVWYNSHSPGIFDIAELSLISTCYLLLTWFLLRQQKFKEILKNARTNL